MGKLVGIYFEILYGFCREWIDIVEGNFFWDFFGLEGS